MLFIDANITSATRQAIKFTFRREKLNDKEKLTEVFSYISERLRRKYRSMLVSNITIQLFEFDGDSFIMNKVSVVFKLKTIEINYN